MLHPLAAFVRNEDAVEYEELLTWNIDPERSLEYELFYLEADANRYRDALHEVESILEYQLTPIDERSFHLWVCQETRPEVRRWRRSFDDRRLVIIPPIRFDEKADMRMTIVGDGDDLQELLDDLHDEIEATVNEIGTYTRGGGTPISALTDRQHEAVTTALALGYYEVPRKAPLTEVAATLGCAESSASLLLRRGERAILSSVLGRYGGTVT